MNTKRVDRLLFKILSFLWRHEPSHNSSDFDSFILRPRRGSKIDTDRFPKQAPKAQASIGSRGTGGRLLQDQISTWKVFFITKNIFVMKNLTDFRKTVEAGVDPRLRQEHLSKRLSNYRYHSRALSCHRHTEIFLFPKIHCIQFQFLRSFWSVLSFAQGPQWL